MGTEEESSERPSSDEEDEAKSPLTITREQLNYYTTQFFSMQPNPRGVIPGSQAKEFFEKSRLPINELRKIWQLSDVTKDGCLSLEEFLTAMHLVVLKRNEINLPQELPPCLHPTNLRRKVVVDNRHNKDLYGGDQPLLGDEDGNKSVSDAKSPSSIISSPGGRPKPANFDFHRPDARRNPNIIQPVAVRLSPESPVIPTSDDEGGQQMVNVKQGRREVHYEQLWNQEDTLSTAEESLSSLTLRNDSKRQNLDRSENTTDEEDMDDENTEIDGLTQPDMSPSPPPVSGLDSAGSAAPASLPHFSEALKRHQPPPLPPPRGSGHARSSSLDLNRFSSAAISGSSARPPAPPPRSGANPADAPSSAKSSREMHINIHRYREQNSVIARTINELHQEVSDALEERIALEFQLEQLKSFGD